MSDFYDVVVVGAGAAGIAAGRRLAKAGVSFVLLEARNRVGGRAHTIQREQALDLGCGWLHSADRNPMVALAEASGFTVDRTPAPWTRQSGHVGVTDAELEDFRKTFAVFENRIDAEAEKMPPVAASAYLESGNRWNPMLHAIFSYISGATLECIDARDYARYEDTGQNWRVREGYGAVFAALGAELPVVLDARVTGVESGAGVRLQTSRGVVEARGAIITVPTSILHTIAFAPEMQEKLEAAAGLPLGTAEKVFFALAEPEEFPVDGHLFPRFDTADMGSYHLRPSGKPVVESYFGGDLARGLAEAGADAMVAYAKEELASLLGSSFPARLTTLASSAWAVDPLAMGSYSYAKPGCAEMRAVLAAPREPLFFAGEACSKHRYSTAHGAFETGHEAAEQVLVFLQRSMPTG
ncbi:flavin monoamine oxidase family protein [Terricaulis silvestris]|uniref:Tryptophan 2-monooxygenase n=1 Tax=Terricaulis silvestris TaxID=2686094 RepID=A0A6I6MWW6_9CAUL|nr:NAD(P)/FAD-dependent oxidoreductase [Terricaulis silvestris]QGZ96122.1 Pseudooxynicotine oxidase [Terricaulis silvestris]